MNHCHFGYISVYTFPRPFFTTPARLPTHFWRILREDWEACSSPCLFEVMYCYFVVISGWGRSGCRESLRVSDRWHSWQNFIVKQQRKVNSLSLHNSKSQIALLISRERFHSSDFLNHYNHLQFPRPREALGHEMYHEISRGNLLTLTQ